MFRIAVLAGAALMTTAANAAEIRVSTAGKSPAEIRAAVGDAALKVCKQAYANDVFAVYERDGCVRDTVADALAKADASLDGAANSKADAAHAVMASH